VFGMISRMNFPIFLRSSAIEKVIIAMSIQLKNTHPTLERIEKPPVVRLESCFVIID
jgi:hypothetical protein